MINDRLALALDQCGAGFIGGRGFQPGNTCASRSSSSNNRRTEAAIRADLISHSESVLGPVPSAFTELTIEDQLSYARVAMEANGTAGEMSRFEDLLTEYREIDPPTEPSLSPATGPPNTSDDVNDYDENGNAIPEDDPSYSTLVTESNRPTQELPPVGLTRPPLTRAEIAQRTLANQASNVVLTDEQSRLASAVRHSHSLEEFLANAGPLDEQQLNNIEPIRNLFARDKQDEVRREVDILHAVLEANPTTSEQDRRRRLALQSRESRARRRVREGLTPGTPVQQADSRRYLRKRQALLNDPNMQSIVEGVTNTSGSPTKTWLNKVSYGPNSRDTEIKLRRVGKQLGLKNFGPEKAMQVLGMREDDLKIMDRIQIVPTAKTRLSIPRISLAVESAKLRVSGTIMKNAAGEIIVHGGYMRIKGKGMSHGRGIHMIRDQISAAKEIGATAIELAAAGDPHSSTFNGYAVWPKVGFDAPLRRLSRTRLDKLNLAFPNNDFETLGDLQKTRPLRKWWKENGTGMDLVFDLRDGSKSLKQYNKIFNRYGVALSLAWSLSNCGASNNGFPKENSCSEHQRHNPGVKQSKILQRARKRPLKDRREKPNQMQEKSKQARQKAKSRVSKNLRGSNVKVQSELGLIIQNKLKIRIKQALAEGDIDKAKLLYKRVKRA